MTDLLDNPWTLPPSDNEPEHTRSQFSSGDIYNRAPVVHIETSAAEVNAVIHVRSGPSRAPPIERTGQRHRLESSIVRFICCYPDCSGSFHNRKTCRQHIRNIHLEPRIYSCSVSGFQTRQKRSWKSHEFSCPFPDSHINHASREQKEFYECPLTGCQVEHAQKNQLLNYLIGCSAIRGEGWP